MKVTRNPPQNRSDEARPADFDSATAMVSAAARFLQGQAFPVLGKPHGDLLRPLLVSLNQLPRAARNWIYRTGSGREGLDPKLVAGADAEHLARGVTGRYAPGRHPAALVGSTPGSAVHLAACLGAPLLPQTLLLPVRRDVGIDDPEADIAAVQGVARELLDRNPDLVVHQMFDPCQDRLTLKRFSYFRVKRLRLGPAYESFLAASLLPGATIFVVRSDHCWPTTALGDRHFFQFGGVGGLAPEEYRDGSRRIAHFLGSQGSPHVGWEPPAPDAERPEAEWGFQPALLDDVHPFAQERGYRVRTIMFDEPDGLSPLVAELYRWWYRQLRRPDDRLFVESFVLLDPYWVLRAGVVPYWMTFNSDNAASHLGHYLECSGPFPSIDIALIANGMSAAGLPRPSTGASCNGMPPTEASWPVSTPDATRATWPRSSATGTRCVGPDRGISFHPPCRSAMPRRSSPTGAASSGWPWTPDDTNSCAKSAGRWRQVPRRKGARASATWVGAVYSAS